ncbi:MAG TPA: hypothetical protein VHB54_10745 [Mucilaginibacter sp.]|nr:hypothetical protein [Mucilaginibacter sp.]
MNFKLKFHTSATTALESYEILARIQLELKDRKYNVEEVTDKTVLFKDNLLRFRSSWSPTMLDEGEFVISDDRNGGRVLTLNYIWNFLPFLIGITIVIILSVFWQDYTVVAFFGVFIAIVTPIDLMRHRGEASELIAAISEADAV